MQYRGFDPPLWRIYPVEVIFALELTWILTPFPKNSFRWEYKPRSSLCTHAFHHMDPDIHVLDGWMPATKHTQHAPSTKTECDYLIGWMKKRSQVQTTLYQHYYQYNYYYNCCCHCCYNNHHHHHLCLAKTKPKKQSHVQTTFYQHYYQYDYYYNCCCHCCCYNNNNNNHNHLCLAKTKPTTCCHKSYNLLLLLKVAMQVTDWTSDRHLYPDNSLFGWTNQHRASHHVTVKQQHRFLI